MTLRYVRSGAAGAANGTDWANAYLTLSAALTASAAGDTIYVSEDHNETTAGAVTLTSPGTAAAPVKVLCVNHSGSVPPVSADLQVRAAQVATSGGNSITFAGSNILYEGIIFTAGSGSTSANITAIAASDRSLKFKGCSLRIGTTSASQPITLGSSASAGSKIILENTTVQFSATGQRIQSYCDLLWYDTANAISGATIPTNLIIVVSGDRSTFIVLRGVDLSACGSGKTLFEVSLAGSSSRISMQDCKIDSAVTVATRQVGRGTGYVELIRVAGDGTNYRQQLINYEGTLTEETTIVRTGGASNGTTTLAWKIVTTANANLLFPFNCPPIAVWNDVTGSAVTATIEGIWGGGAVPNNDEIWVEAQYLGSNASPIASFVNDGPADSLAAAAGQSGSSETWGGSTTKFKLEVTFTPEQKGWVLLTVKIGKASTTAYIDPKVTLS